MSEPKIIKINDYEIEARPIPAIKALSIRNDLIEYFKSNANFTSMDFAGIGKLMMSLYSTPMHIVKPLFGSCTVKGVGYLSDDETINKVFEKDVDKILEVVIEVIDYNGFFTKSLFMNLVNKFPILNKAKEEVLGFMKGRTSTLEDLAAK